MNLNPSQEKVFKESVRILNTLGYKIIDERILSALRDNGFKVEGNFVYFTEEQIKDALEAAPKSFKLNARNPEKSIILGEGRTKIASGYGCPFIMKRNGDKRDATFKDFINFARLVHMSGCHDTNGGQLAQPSDISIKECYPAMLYATIMTSDMPIIGISAHENEVRATMELAEIAFGGKEKFRNGDYYILSLMNLQAPLTMGDYGEQTLLVATEYNQPLIMTPGLSAGGTAPVTPAGQVVLGNAEIIAAVTVAQTLRRGIPIVFGLNGTVLDMKTGEYCLANPYSEQIRTWGRQLAVAYGMPSRNGGSFADAKSVGIQSTHEGMLTLMHSMKENTSISLHCSGVLDSMRSMSYEKFMIDCEMIRTIQKASEPVELTEELMAYEAVEEAGHGGNFLSNSHTLEYFREYQFEYKYSSTVDTLKQDQSKADDLYFERAEKQMNEWFDSYKRPEIDPVIKAEMEDYLLNKVGVAQSVIDQVYA